MFAILTGILSIAILIAFFYLVHLVSHIRNILRAHTYWDIVADAGNKIVLTEIDLKNLQRMGIISDQQRSALMGILDKQAEQQ